MLSIGADLQRYDLRNYDDVCHKTGERIIACDGEITDFIQTDKYHVVVLVDGLSIVVVNLETLNVRYKVTSMPFYQKCLMIPKIFNAELFPITICQGKSGLHIMDLKKGEFAIGMAKTPHMAFARAMLDRAGKRICVLAMGNQIFKYKIKIQTYDSFE